MFQTHIAANSSSPIHVAELCEISSIPVGIELICSGIGLFFNPNAKFSSLIQHLSAGVIIGAVSIELIPLLLQSFTSSVLNYFCVFVPFGVAVCGLLALDRAVQRRRSAPEDQEQEHHLPITLLSVTATGLFLDGVLLSLTYSRHHNSGLVVAVAFAVETGVLGFMTSATLRHRKSSAWCTILVGVMFGVLVALGSVVGALMFAQYRQALLLGTLSFGIGVFLFLILDSLLLEARHDSSSMTWFGTLSLYAGLAAVLALHFSIVAD